MAAPVTSGIGSGLAQVFDTRSTVRYVSQLRMQKQMQDEKYASALMADLAKIDPSKVREADRPEFKEKYDRLKRIYITNKDLYRNPLKNLNAFNEAEKLKSEIDLMIADGKQVNDVLSKFGSGYISNPNKYTQASVELYQKLQSTPTSKIKESFGRNIDVTDFEFKPEPLDVQKLSKEFADMASKMEGGYITSTVTEKGDNSNGIPLGRVKTTTKKLATLDAVELFVSSKWLDDNFRINMQNAFETSNEAEIEAMEQSLKELYPDSDIAITDAETFAKGFWALRYRVIGENERFDPDKEYEQQIYNQRRAQALADRMSIADYNAELRSRAQRGNKSVDDLLMEDAKKMISALNIQDHNEFVKAWLPIYKMGLVIDTPHYLDPNKYNSAKEFYEAYQKLANEDSFKVNPNTLISERDANEIYNKKSKLLFITTTPSSPGDKPLRMFFSSVRPTQNASILWSVLKRGIGTTPKQGVSSGYEGLDFDLDFSITQEYFNNNEVNNNEE